MHAYKKPTVENTTLTPWNPSRKAIARIKDPLPIPTVCRYCGGPVEIVTHQALYGQNYGRWPWAYACRTVGCSTYVGLHPFTNLPLGTLANSDLRYARRKAHEAFDPLWNKDGSRFSRTGAYNWLSCRLNIPLPECHISMFEIDTCEKVVQICKELRSN